MNTTKLRSEKDKNRSEFPVTASIMDEFRKIFGDGVKLKWSEENGKILGKKSD